MKRTAIRLPDATYDRLRALVERSGRTAAFHIRESLERYLEDVEDLHVAENAAAGHRKSGSLAFSLDELDRYLGLED